VAVDGRVVHRSRRWRRGGLVCSFRIGGHACAVLCRRGRGAERADLVVDGRSLRTGLHPALKPPREGVPAADPGGFGTELAPPFVPLAGPRGRSRGRLGPLPAGMVRCAACGAPNRRPRPGCYACGAPLPPAADAALAGGPSRPDLPSRFIAALFPVRWQSLDADSGPELLIFLILLVEALHYLVR
jgi:hypothetical protein